MHIKYKAADWNSIYGQEHIKKVVNSVELNGRAFLFEGEKGTGKSQMAILLSKMIGCSDDSITQIDCVKISGAGAEVMRDLINEFTSNSVFDGAKALILDEIQELSHKAQEVLLNPLLNLPDKTIVIACSAIPEKIESMLLDRFTILKTRSLDEKTSIEYLQYILSKEEVTLPKWKKLLILSHGQGNPRKILKAIPIVMSSSEETDINYMLIVSNLRDIGGESADLFRFLLSISKWGIILKKIEDVLKLKTAATIRMDLINLIAYKIKSTEISKGEGAKLIRISNILRKDRNIPERSTLIIDLYNSYIVIHK